MPTPYVGFSNASLAQMPVAKLGEMITCPHCHEQHELVGDDPEFLMFYRCGGVPFLGAVKGKLVIGWKADCSGDVAL